MKLSEICARAMVYCPREKESLEITSVTCDSRRVVPGALFVCLPGTKKDVKGKTLDGTAFIADARERGCAAILCENEDYVKNELYSSDTLAAMSALCRAFYGEGIEKLRLVGVTGTNGKSSCVAMLKAIADADGRRCASVGTLGCNSGNTELDLKYSGLIGQMTTPDPEVLYPMLASLAADGNEFVFLEASSHALARKKLSSLDFELGVFTNLTRDHLDFHLTRENYLAAKAELVSLCRGFIVNADDPSAERIAKNAFRCSEKGNGDMNAEQTEFFGGGGFRSVFRSAKGSIAVESTLVGDYQVMNALECAACARLLGISDESIVNGIRDFRGARGRCERVIYDPDKNISVYTDYAHTPSSLEKLLISLRRLYPDNKLTVLFGCGGDRDRGKRKLMGIAASALADFTVITSDNPRSEDPRAIISDVMQGIDKEKPYAVIESRREAIKYVIKNARHDETVVLAGKGHEKYEIDGTGIHPFDEAEIVISEWRRK